MSGIPKSGNAESIAERHRRWIFRGTVAAALVAGLAANSLVQPLGLPLVVDIAAIGLAVVWTLALVPYVLARIVSGLFITKLVNARLELRPSASSDRAEQLMPWFVEKGFTDHGSWMLVGAECGTIFGGVGSRLLHDHDRAVLAVIHDTQINLASDLSNGRTLVTSSLGVVPHPALTVQGIKGGELPALFDLHVEALRRLAATGVTAVTPAGGPLQARLRFELLDQEYFRSIPRSEARSFLFSIVDQPLEPLTV